MKTARNFTLKVALFPESAGKFSGWVAQCLDLNLVAQGDTTQSAQAAFKRVLTTHIWLCHKDGRDPLSGVKIQSPKSKRGSMAASLDNLRVSFGRLADSRAVRV